ncbi:hypothetical protein BV20DRAFT_418907 [Pilatotrama ljubarskyi]|nr:hypothetical protein BV20DRAFT_418907 [Pilatotrama ljubarskyi]
MRAGASSPPSRVFCSGRRFRWNPRVVPADASHENRSIVKLGPRAKISIDEARLTTRTRTQSCISFNSGRFESKPEIVQLSACLPIQLPNRRDR